MRSPRWVSSYRSRQLPIVCDSLDKSRRCDRAVLYYGGVAEWTKARLCKSRFHGFEPRHRLVAYEGDQKRAYQNAWIQARRAAWIQENGPCVDCGSEENLEVDHRDASTKLLNPSKLWSLSLANPARIAELAKCVVRCNPCHEIKTQDNNERSRRWEDNSQSKLTFADAENIRSRYAEGIYRYKDLAVDYGVDPVTIGRIVRGVTYKRL